MKISIVTIEDLKEYARIDHSDDDNLFRSILVACKSYIKTYTGLTLEQMDDKEDLTMALFILSNEMYDNRAYTIQNDKVNVVVKSILDMHSMNLL